MELGGWCGGAPALSESFAAQEAQMLEANESFDATELQDLQTRALRVLLGSEALLLHSQLRHFVLGGRGADESSSRSKCLLELAVASLVEQGLVVRSGFGAFSALSVPDCAVPKAEALAYSEFPDEGSLPLYSSAAAAAGLVGGGGAAHHCPTSRLNRMRRHSSPRQFGRMAGIEKAGAGRRSKRSISEEMSSQLQKKMRFQDGGGMGMGSGGGGNGGTGMADSTAAAAAAASFGCSLMAMSP